MKKILATVGLFIVLAGGTYAGYAYWDSLQVVDSASTITIGEGQSISKTISLAEVTDKTLVPAGVVLGDDDIESAVITYKIVLSKEVSDDMTLTAVVSDKKIGDSTVYADLAVIDITYTNGGKINAAAFQTVTITVTLTEPDATEYAAIRNKDITFTVTFTVA